MSSIILQFAGTSLIIPARWDGFRRVYITQPEHGQIIAGLELDDNNGVYDPLVNETVVDGTNLYLTVVPNYGYAFDKWVSPVASQENPLHIVVSRNLHVSATLIQLPEPPEPEVPDISNYFSGISVFYGQEEESW